MLMLLVEMFDGAANLNARAFVDGGAAADLERDLPLEGILNEGLVDGQDPGPVAFGAGLHVARFRFGRFGAQTLVRRFGDGPRQRQLLLALHFAHFETSVARRRTLFFINKFAYC